MRICVGEVFVADTDSFRVAIALKSAVVNQTVLGTSYSSTVRLELHVGDQIFDLHEIGPRSISLRKPVALAPTKAEVVMYIDGRRRSWQVELPDGLSADAELARIVILK